MIGIEQPRPRRRGGTLLAIILLLPVLFSAGATQIITARLSYHPALGRPLVRHVYPPWAWIGWNSRFRGSAPHLFAGIHAAAGAFGIAAALAALFALGLHGRTARRHEGVHGTAHWASRAEIEATSLLPRRGQPGAGVYVGGWCDARGRLHYLRHNGPEHVAAIAPTRSGKGVALVVPTLLSWPHSLVVNDQKAELWHLTAGWRAAEAGNVVLRFDPGAPSGSIAFNPLAEVRLGTLHEVGDVQNLSTIMVDPEGKGLIDHWAKTSHAFLTGVILHVLYRAKATGGIGALPQVALALSDPAQPIDKLYREMLDNKWAGGTTHPTIAAAVQEGIGRAVRLAGPPPLRAARRPPPAHRLARQLDEYPPLVSRAPCSTSQGFPKSAPLALLPDRSSPP